MMYEDIVYKLMTHFTSGEFEAEAIRARVQFSKIAGVFDEEAPDFEVKMAQYTDWYLFTRPLADFNETPVRQSIIDKVFVIPDEDKIYYQNLANNRHSLFEFIKLKGADVHVKDLYSGYKLVIKDSKVNAGFEKDQIFEARLFPDGDNFVFANAFCFHPHEATKYISKEVKRVNTLGESERDSAREELIEKLFAMKYKTEQYRHVDVKDIYSNEPRLR
ncbi:MAG: hypothetical protein KDD61_05615 [Bdellovibrionales bacterium]|nr:hypothetical protein [Bdellovibrionales bacterium]